MYQLNIIGALTAQAIFFLSILIFAARIARRQRLAFWLGIPQLLTGIVLIYLLIQAPKFGRPGLYYAEIGLMLFWLLLKLVLVYLLGIELRRSGWAVLYRLLFFIGTAGMVVIASEAGIFWMIQAIIFYLVMIAMAFVQRTRAETSET